MRRSRRTLTPMEDLIQGTICELLRFKAHRDTIWCAIPNGIPCSARIGARFVRLGLVKGTADLLVIPPGGMACFMEVKSQFGTLSEAQRAFKLRCEAAGVPYAVVRSSHAAEATLASWGALRAKQEWSRAA